MQPNRPTRLVTLGISTWLFAGAAWAQPAPKHASPNRPASSQPAPLRDAEDAPTPSKGKKDPWALAAKATELFGQGEYAKAEAILLEQLELQPDNFVVHYNLACARSMQGDAAGAMTRLKRAIELGFSDLRHLEKDPTLRAVRTLPEYAKIVEGWDKILEASRDANVGQAKTIFKRGYSDSRDEALRLVYLSAFDEKSVAQVRAEVSRLAAWANREVMPGALDAQEIAKDAWVVVILPNKGDFTKWAIASFGESAIRTTSAIGGSYQNDQKRLVSMDLGSTLRHEFFHVLHWRDMTRRGQQHAIWIMEGLCSLVEDYDLGNDGSLTPATSWRTNTVKRLASMAKLMPIEDLAKMPQSKFTGARPLANYALARSVFLYLYQEGKLKDWYHVYTTDRDAGYRADATGIKAMEAVFEKSIADINKDFRAWVKALPAVAEEIQRGMASLGIEVETGDGDGLVVTGGPRRPGLELRPGDVITAIDGKPVREMAELVRVLGGYEPDANVAISYRRGRLHKETTITLVTKR